MNCEEKDLFQKCQDIISDDKLSEDDVRQLSEYINASPNAADTLIGKQLVGPLQKVWVDGVVDERELNMLAGLLISIVHPEPPSGVSSTAGITVPSSGSSVIIFHHRFRSGGGHYYGPASGTAENTGWVKGSIQVDEPTEYKS